MKLGKFEIHPVIDGRFRLDGGAMFGVVPKVLWEQCCPADEQNRISLSLTCLLVKAHGKNILVDTGIGSKSDSKLQRMFAVDRTPTLIDSLNDYGVAPEDVDLVVNTHLHFDHAGGNTCKDEQGALLPTFPKAQYVVQRGEYEDACTPSERTRASYRKENVDPVADLKRWELLNGDTELLPGISAIVTQGHTRHHQSVKMESEGQVAVFLGDVIPTISHLPLPYVMGYDLYPLQTVETKRWLLDRAHDENWLFFFEHDPRVQMGRVKKDIEGKYYLTAA